jgi:hypothetical protein
VGLVNIKPITIGVGAVVGAAGALGTARLLTDEHVPSKISPVYGGLGIASGAAAGTYLTHGMPRDVLAGAAFGAVIGGALGIAIPGLVTNDHHGVLAGAYEPERLILIKPNVHVEGKVSRVSYPGDGDIHINVDVKGTPYDQYAHGSRHPHTVIAEPVPDDQGRIQVPHVGDTIAVDGPLVWDSTHGWAEVHPVKDLTFVHADGPRPPRDAKDRADVAKRFDHGEQQRERRAFIGGGIALAGTALLVSGGYQGAKHVGLVGSAAAKGGGWGGAAMLLAAGGVGILAGAVIGGQNKD